MSEPEKPEKVGLLSRSPFYEIKQLFSIGMTIACMVLAILAYIDLNNYTSDVQDILHNWKTPPVLEVYVANYSAGCLDGYSEFNLANSDFPGLSKGHCACTATSLSGVSSYPNCSSDVELTAECMSANSLDSVSAKSWRRERICFKRGGIGSVNFKDGYFRRPYPDSDGTCPEDFKLCGSGTYEDNRAICFPKDLECPITGLLISTTIPTGGSWIQSDGIFGRDNSHLYYRREYPDELPVVDLKIALTKYSGDYLIDNYDGENNQRGPCYVGTNQKYTTSVKVSETTLTDYTLKPPSSCSKPDLRYVLYDRQRLDQHYLAVLEQTPRYCKGFTLYTKDDPLYQTLSDPDYLSSGIACGTSPYQCNRDADMGTNCLVTDAICDLVVNQNLCGQYAQAIRDIGQSENTFGLYRRSEIVWLPDCEVDREAIYTNRDPLEAALMSQLAVVVIGCLFGVLAGIIWPCAMLTVLRKEFCNVVNYKVTVMDRADPWIHFFKIMPLVPSIYYVGKIYKLFATAGKDDCSDPTSNNTFDFLAETLPSIYQKSLTNAVLEAISILMGLYFYRQKVVKARKHFAGKVVPTDDPSPVPPQQPAIQMAPMQQPIVYQQLPMQQQQQPYGQQQPYMVPMGAPQQPYGMGAPQPYVQMQPQYQQQPHY